MAEALSFAGEGLVHATVKPERIEDINDVFDRMRAGKIDGRTVLDITGTHSGKSVKEDGVLALA